MAEDDRRWTDDDVRTPVSWRNRVSPIVWLAVLLTTVALIAPLLIWRTQIAAIFADREHVVAEVRGAGAWGPLVVIGLVAAQTIVAPIPGQVVGFVAGYVFGFWHGMLYGWLGTVLGSALAMVIARVAGRPLVSRLVKPVLLERMDRLALGRGLLFFFLVFLIPGLPDDMMCFVAGLTPLSLPALMLISAIGRVPGISGAVWAGAYAERMPWQAWLIGGGLILVAAALMWRYGKRLQDGLLQRIGRCAKFDKDSR